MPLSTIFKLYRGGILNLHNKKKSRRGRMVVGFTTTCEISAYHH
jgi:hypothetical protein